MGRGYVIEHCISAFAQMQKDQLYKIYVTEMLKGLASFCGHKVELSYHELISGSGRSTVEEEKTPEDVINNIRNKLAQMGGEQ